MSDNLDKLKGHSDRKHDINRNGSADVKGKEGIKLSKRIEDLRRVINDPDVWNANIASRDRMDEMEQRLEEIEQRVNGMRYLVKRLVMNKRIQEDQLQVLEEPTEVSGSGE